MTITNEEQAQASANYIKAAECLIATYPNELFAPTSTLEKHKAALAAYEQRKAMQFEGLDEVTKARLVLWGMTDEESAHSTQFLRERGWLDQNDCAIKSIGTDYRAYLAAQKRELRWEVWAKPSIVHGNKGVICCTCYNVDSARLIKGFYEDWRPTAEYEVREVRDAK